ncbi:hypothetical protein BTS2_2405 [Bacillus sp. TS-2]|nr:hypothetical protein BTS2_2405 [Bacillus sp. TS-2]
MLLILEGEQINPHLKFMHWNKALEAIKKSVTLLELENLKGEMSTAQCEKIISLLLENERIFKVTMANLSKRTS